MTQEDKTLLINIDHAIFNFIDDMRFNCSRWR